ncbi:glycosyltransferase family 4 protein [Horticoccus luteus]|uniref:Glycosyltransferase family 4 protein n=1 Tax=Horticoccus luteus TaxID=2862869 RepID=A0A8F9TV05_9BACT|nr:glycosyltransferase family 1 protein [Horticoccus luteus]QYM79769.1 glycosyltransferase family 4 protein [Horticoccus luteus]
MSASSGPVFSSSSRSLAHRIKRWLCGDAPRPITVGVDLLLMQPGGANGGVKPLVFSFLGEIGRAQGRRLKFVFFASPELAPEIAPILRSHDELAHPTSIPPAIDVLYAVFGRSNLSRTGLPSINLIVDLLHKDLPAALPVEEVNYRHEWFSTIAAQATFFQCISHYTAERLQYHYHIPAERCFVTHIPVHQRLRPDHVVKAESSPVAKPFFFYPANFWPHKNHEVLLLAYRGYVALSKSAAWPLVFTGHPDERTVQLRLLVSQLGLNDRVHFLGHLSTPQFAALWSQAGALVYPSRHEGFGIPLLEAMAYRCPIIAARTTSIPEIAGDACLYVDPSDTASISSALQQVSADAQLRTALVRAGKIRLRTFSLARETAKLAAHFISAASAAPLRP